MFLFLLARPKQSEGGSEVPLKMKKYKNSIVNEIWLYFDFPLFSVSDLYFLKHMFALLLFL